MHGKMVISLPLEKISEISYSYSDFHFAGKVTEFLPNMMDENQESKSKVLLMYSLDSE